MDQNRRANGLVNALLAGHFPRILLLGMAAVITSGFVGCGGSEAPPKLATVKGKVTINGLPAADLAVTFESQVAGGGRSAGVTNALGEYELSYAESSPSPKGAAIGQHLVRINSAAAASPGTLAAGGAGGSPTDLGPTDDSAVPSIIVPEKYNSATELKASVLAGDNPPINFDLQIPKK